MTEVDHWQEIISRFKTFDSAHPGAVVLRWDQPPSGAIPNFTVHAEKAVYESFNGILEAAGLVIDRQNDSPATLWAKCLYDILSPERRLQGSLDDPCSLSLILCDVILKNAFDRLDNTPSEIVAGLRAINADWMERRVIPRPGTMRIGSTVTEPSSTDCCRRAFDVIASYRLKTSSLTDFALREIVPAEVFEAAVENEWISVKSRKALASGSTRLGRYYVGLIERRRFLSEVVGGRIEYWRSHLHLTPAKTKGMTRVTAIHAEESSPQTGLAPTSVGTRLTRLWQETKTVYRQETGRKLTQDEVAAKVGIGKRTFQRHLKDLFVPTPEQINDYCTFFSKYLKRKIKEL